MNKTKMDKEQYFTEQNIDSVAPDFLKKIQPMLRHHSIDLNLKKTALCVVDMQNYFLNSHA